MSENPTDDPMDETIRGVPHFEPERWQGPIGRSADNYTAIHWPDESAVPPAIKAMADDIASRPIPGARLAAFLQRVKEAWVSFWEVGE